MSSGHFKKNTDPVYEYSDVSPSAKTWIDVFTVQCAASHAWGSIFLGTEYIQSVSSVPFHILPPKESSLGLATEQAHPMQRSPFLSGRSFVSM